MLISIVEDDTPQPSQEIFVDTNVLLFQAYPGVTLGVSDERKVEADKYLKYLKEALNVGAKLIVFGTNLVEMAHVIERCEFEAWKAEIRKKDGKKAAKSLNIKECRLDAAFKKRVSNNVDGAWAEIQSLVSVPDITIGYTIARAASAKAAADGIDVTDAVHLEAMKLLGIRIILTDDSDFANVDDPITVVTGNVNSISKATSAGKIAKHSPD